MAALEKQFGHLKILIEAVKLATDDFSDGNCIGKGGFGKVYKGELVRFEEGQTMVAFKRLDRAFGQGDPEFWKEIMMLSFYKHPNIVSLVGYCDDCGEKILVYEYAQKGSLDLYLDSDELSWIRRLKICIGAARGLAYLHCPTGNQLRVLHRDIKSSNILLDENWSAKISDFGLSKFGPANKQFTFLVSNAVGTVGYCDPLYVETGLLTKESDVYSFGVVLFEVLCGRLCIGNDNNKHRPLTGLVRRYYKENKLQEIIHGNIKNEIIPKSLETFANIAYQCLIRDREERPLMTDVVDALETALIHQCNHRPASILPVGYSGQSNGQNSYSSDDLPKAMVMTLSQGSAVKSMEFHPVRQILLLVGTNTGEVMIWDLGSRQRLVHRNFNIWDFGSCPMPLQASLVGDYTTSINCVTWSPDGTLFGVAYSKHVVQIYSYHGYVLRNLVEIYAHVGSVNDLAFSYPYKRLCIVTCGDDMLIKVWDVVTGGIQYTLQGHEAPVYSVCAQVKENLAFIYSISTDMEIKAWLYDDMGSRMDWDAPGCSSTTMAYSADGKRLFSCGTSSEGESFLVEWDDRKGAIKRIYNGLGKRSVGVVQFDTTQNRFLAAGDEGLVKFWDMDDVNLLATTDAEGGLVASPCIRFNKEGTLLAVSTNENGVKILANPDGIQLLRTLEKRSFDASRIASASVVKTSPMSTSGAANQSAGPSMMDRIGDESMDKSRIWKLT